MLVGLLPVFKSKTFTYHLRTFKTKVKLLVMEVSEERNFERITFLMRLLFFFLETKLLLHED